MGDGVSALSFLSLLLESTWLTVKGVDENEKWDDEWQERKIVRVETMDEEYL